MNGNNVTLYGLFVEHSQEYQTIWNGNGGRVYFYQSEMPYDPPAADAWRHGSVSGYASYKVADTVTTHEAWGLGVYCYFTAAPIVAENAVETPTAAGVKIHHIVSIRLNGLDGSGIKHVINGTGSPVIKTMKATVQLSRMSPRRNVTCAVPRSRRNPPFPGNPSRPSNFIVAG